MGAHIGGDRRREGCDLRRVDQTLLLVEDMGAGEAVGVASLERHLDGDLPLRAQLDPRGREIDLVGFSRPDQDDAKQAGSCPGRPASIDPASRARPDRFQQLDEASSLELGHRHDVTVRRKAGVAIETVGGGAELKPR